MVRRRAVPAEKPLSDRVVVRMEYFLSGLQNPSQRRAEARAQPRQARQWAEQNWFHFLLFCARNFPQHPQRPDGLAGDFGPFGTRNVLRLRPRSSARGLEE